MFSKQAKEKACFNLVMNGFWCWMSGRLTTYRVCEVLGCCLDAARLPVDHVFYYRSKDKSSFTSPPLCEGEELFISDIHLLSETFCTGWRQNVGCWNFTTNIKRASLDTSSQPLAVWNTIWVGPSPRSLRLNKKKPLECAKVHGYC